MNPFILVSDPSGLGALWNDAFLPSFGGSYILFGILILMALVYFLIFSRIKAGGVVVSGLGIIYLLSTLNPAFKFVFYLAVIVSVIVLVIGLKNNLR